MAFVCEMGLPFLEKGGSDDKLTRVRMIYQYVPFVSLSPMMLWASFMGKTKTFLTHIKQKKEQ